MIKYKLNGTEMTELNPGAPIIDRPQKKIYKDGTWKIKGIQGVMKIPCKIEYSSKEELVNKLNSVDVYLQNGVLTLDNYRYNIKVVSGLKPEMNFSNFTLVFQTDEYEIEFYPYTQTTPYAGTYNPLNSYNFTGTTSPVVTELADIEIDGREDNFITGDFVCIDMAVSASYIPEGFTLIGNEIQKEVDVSI